MRRPPAREVALVALVVVLASFWARLVLIPPFPELQVEASEEKYDFDVGEPGPWFSAWSVGDGQAYALIALDPTGKKLAEEIGEAGYRFARAGYGWLAWAGSFGQAEAVPYAMAAVGALAVAGVFLVALRARSRIGPAAWLIVVNPALYIGFAGDTSEPLGILLLSASLLYGSWLAAVGLGLSRPTFAVALWGRWRLVAAAAGAAVALALYGVVVFGAEAMVPSGGRVGLPLVSYIQHPSIAGFALAAAMGATLVIGVRKRDWAWVVAALFVACFGDDVLRDPVNAWRAAGFLPVLWAFGPNYRISLQARSQEGTATEG